MNELIKLMKNPALLTLITRISIASPDEIISWSHERLKTRNNKLQNF